MERYDIAIDARMINSSGIGTYLQNILPDVCRTFKTALVGIKKELQGHQAEIVEFDAPIYSIKETIGLPSKIPHCRIFWSPHYNVPVFKNRAEHIITTIHDVYHLAFYENLDFKQKAYAKFFYNLAVKQSDQIITVSNFSKQEIIKFTSSTPERIKVIHNGVIQENFSKTFNSSEIQRIKKKYNLPQNYILFVGNVKPHKNLNNLVFALGNIFKKNESLYLVIVGKKEGFITGDSQLGKLIESHPLYKNRVIFTGFADQADLPLIYQEASLFVMPSIYEGFGLPPLEAMSANTLTVVSNAASLPEVCKKGALYFNPHNLKDIETTLEYAISLSSDEKNKIKKIAKEVCQQYTWEKSVKEHLNLFDEYFRI